MTARLTARYNNWTETDRWKDRWINRATVWMDRLADEQINRWTDRKADGTVILLINAEGDVDRQTYKQISAQTDKDLQTPI